MEQPTVSNYQVIMSQIQELQSQADAMRHAERVAALDQIQSIMRGYDISIQDIRAGKILSASATAPSKTRRSSAPAKFLHPGSGKTWSGRGRMPKWIESEISSGASLEQFRITN